MRPSGKKQILLFCIGDIETAPTISSLVWEFGIQPGDHCILHSTHQTQSLDQIATAPEEWGDHTGQAYSKRGCTRQVEKGGSVTISVEVSIIPSILWALEQTMSMWLDHVRLFEMLTPRYLRNLLAQEHCHLTTKWYNQRLYLFLLISITLGLSVRFPYQSTAFSIHTTTLSWSSKSGSAPRIRSWWQICDTQVVSLLPSTAIITSLGRGVNENGDCFVSNDIRYFRAITCCSGVHLSSERGPRVVFHLFVVQVSYCIQTEVVSSPMKNTPLY